MVFKTFFAIGYFQEPSYPETEALNYFFLPGFLLNKKPGVRQPQRIEKARLLIANTPMDTDKIKVFGSRVKVDSIAKVAELELAEKEKMKEKVSWLFELPALLRESF